MSRVSPAGRPVCWELELKEMQEANFPVSDFKVLEHPVRARPRFRVSMRDN